MNKQWRAVILFVAIVWGAYWGTLRFYYLRALNKEAVSLNTALGLTAQQKQEIAPLDKDYQMRKEKTCDALVWKRAQLIQLLKQEEQDPRVTAQLIEEIGREQIALEKATMDHLIALQQHLSKSQREKLVSIVTEELRTACKATACGITPGCRVTSKEP